MRYRAVMASKKALLIDANSLLHRAWHALPPLTTPDGKLINAAYGFTSVLQKILTAERPEYLVVCWDTRAPTFRHEAEPTYKAQREKQSQDLYDQIPYVKEIVEAFGGTNLELDGYEADDLLGTVANRLAKDKIDVLILTSDRDIWQVIGPKIKVMVFKKGVSETVTYDTAMLKEMTGLTPTQIVDYKAMRGDASDNLKGIPGIGEKTATELLLKYKSLKRILNAAHDTKSDMASSVRNKLIIGEASALATLPLVRIVTDVPISVKPSKLIRRPVDEKAIRELFVSLGFKTLLVRAFGNESKERMAKLANTSIHVTTPPLKAARHIALIRAKKLEHSEKIEHLIIKTAVELAHFLDHARDGQMLIVHPIIMAQASLFADISELALGVETGSALLARSIFTDTKALSLLVEIFADRHIHKIGHRLKDAWHWCHSHGYALEGISFDTQIASYLLAAGEGGHDLQTLAATKLSIFISDGEDRYYEEVDAIRKVTPILTDELQSQDLKKILDRFELPLIPILGEMEIAGILINRPYFKGLTQDFRAEKSRLEQEMIALAGEEFNPASPIQLAHILFNVLKLSPKGIKRGKTGYSTAASELEKLEGMHPLIVKISEFREVTKLLSTYVEALPALADADGRVHTTFNQVVTSTGRLSSTNPNLQNIPIRTELGRKIRRGFIAPNGRRLLSCDYSQIELRVIAALSKDKKMLEAFENGLDIHMATAAAIWHIPLNEVTKDQRRAAKAINFGVIYGQGPQGLSKSANISYFEAKQFIEEYFHVYSGIREYLDQTKTLAHANGYVETFFGRRRLIPDINSLLPQLRAAAERMAINMPVQGTGTGDLVKLAMIKIAKDLPAISKDSRLLLQVHDEVVLEVPEKEVTIVANAVRDIMENIEKIGCPIVVDAKAGKNWEEMKKVE